MDKIRARELENILGIYSPFYIKDIQLNHQNETCKVIIEELHNKSRILGSRIKETTEQITFRWKHIKFGHYRTIIKFRTSKSNHARLMRPVCPAFLGAIGKDYTQQVEDLVLFGHNNKLDPESISTLSGIDSEDIKIIIIKNQNEKIKKQTSNLLPLETDPIWVKIIKREFHLKTNLTPLRMLLHRLELLDVNNYDNDKSLQESVATLRAFFIKNKANLKQEYFQIGAKPDKESKTEESKKTTRSLTPTHPVWDKILTEKISVMSSNLAFNLYISRLKNLYTNDLTPSEKRDIIVEMMKYLKKNIKGLRAELIYIRRIAESLDNEPVNTELPEKDNMIWRDIINERLNLNSKKLNLNLLMVKLKGQMAQGLEEETCGELQKFFTDNHRALKSEIAIIKNELSQVV